MANAPSTAYVRFGFESRLEEMLRCVSRCPSAFRKVTMKLVFVKSRLVAEEGWEGGYTVLDELAIYPFMLNVGFPLATALATWLRELDPLN